MKYSIWYMRSEHFPDGIMGYNWCQRNGKLPDPHELEKTHILLKEGVEARSLERLFLSMQAENWSAKGEAKALILSKGLHHTSMCVGDIAVDASGKTSMVDQWGFKELPRVKSVSVAS